MGSISGARPELNGKKGLNPFVRAVRRGRAVLPFGQTNLLRAMVCARKIEERQRMAQELGEEGLP